MEEMVCNKDLLLEVQKEKLNQLLSETNDENTFREAMAVTEKIVEIEKLKSGHLTDSEKEEERKQKKKDRIVNLILDGVKIFAAPAALLLMKFLLGRSNMKLIGEIEQYETPVTTPGKAQHKSMIDDYRL